MLSEKIDQQIASMEAKINNLEEVKKLIEIYPDMKEQSDRWRDTYYTSSLINEKVDQLDIGHACGCCNDSPLLAYFFTVVNGIRLYADPFSICIGEQNAGGYGDYPNPKWKEILKENRIPENMWGKVQEYFDKHPPEYDDEDEDN